MFRGISVLACLMGAAVAASGDEKEKDEVREKLFSAKVAYDKEMSQVRGQVGDWFDKREETARKAGDKKLIDRLKDERKAYDEDGEFPKGVPTAVLQKQDKAKKSLEAAFAEAVKAYTKAKKDDLATAVEKDWLEFNKNDKWKHLDLAKVKLVDDYIRIPPNTSLPTTRKYTGGLEVVVVARTESENIRLYGPQGTSVIFNWEANPRELRVTRPDGGDRPESGSAFSAKFTPLKANTWYTLKWRITEEGMQVSVDGKVVFEEKKQYELTTSAPATVHTIKSVVDVKEFRVTPIGK